MFVFAIDFQRQQQGSRFDFLHAEMKAIDFLFPSYCLYKQLPGEQ